MYMYVLTNWCSYQTWSSLDGHDRFQQVAFHLKHARE